MITLSNPFNQGYPNPSPFNNSQQEAPRGRGGRRGGHGGKKGGARAAFSAEGPVLDRTKSTIVVENIPRQNFDEAQVRAFYSQFGDIEKIYMQDYRSLAVITFAS